MFATFRDCYRLWMSLKDLNPCCLDHQWLLLFLPSTVAKHIYARAKKSPCLLWELIVWHCEALIPSFSLCKWYLLNFFLVKNSEKEIGNFSIIFFDWFFSCIDFVDIMSFNITLANTLLNVWVRKANISIPIYICSIFANYYFRKFALAHSSPQSYFHPKKWHLLYTFRALAICYFYFSIQRAHFCPWIFAEITIACTSTWNKHKWINKRLRFDLFRYIFFVHFVYV